MNLGKVEEFLARHIFPELEKGRPVFDVPHTKAVVHHLKEINAHSLSLDLDLPVLICAAYCHDWGYSGLFKGGSPIDSLDTVMEAKPKHMILGAEKTSGLLTLEFFSFLDSQQKERVVHLVAVHDQLDNLSQTDELVLMEADTLGGLDADMVKPTFDFASNERYVRVCRMKRLPLFITDFGKEEFERLYKVREAYYKKLK